MTTATTAVPRQREPELRGQTVVVIGGSAGIGLETARRARAEGADVILAGRSPDRLDVFNIFLFALQLFGGSER
jgi:NAD(P)-dependent dehydrogenase (short-subunit alcohol dehydrogenase family)